jgi:hypothetical protein
VGAIILLVAVLLIVPDNSGRLVGVLTVFGLVLAAMAVPRPVPPPKLELTFRRRDSNAVAVVLRNKGKGQAENVEVEFQPGMATVYDESGRSPGPSSHLTDHPPRYSGRDRVLGPGDEWVIAELAYYGSNRPPESYMWKARAKGMKSEEGKSRSPLFSHH